MLNNNEITRRQLGGVLLVLSSLSCSASAQGETQATLRFPILELDLPPSVLPEIRREAEELLRETRWLEELPLENVNPGFVFIPH